MSIPCEFCQFYASVECRGCIYFNDCYGSIVGERVPAAEMSVDEARNEANRIFKEWLRHEYPHTWWMRGIIDRLYIKFISRPRTRIKDYFRIRKLLKSGYTVVTEYVDGKAFKCYKPPQK